MNDCFEIDVIMLQWSLIKRVNKFETVVKYKSDSRRNHHQPNASIEPEHQHLGISSEIKIRRGLIIVSVKNIDNFGVPAIREIVFGKAVKNGYESVNKADDFVRVFVH